MQLPLSQRLNSIATDLYKRGRVDAQAAQYAAKFDAYLDNVAFQLQRNSADLLPEHFRGMVGEQGDTLAVGQGQGLAMRKLVELGMKRFLKGFAVAYGVAAAVGCISVVFKSRFSLGQIWGKWKDVLLGEKIYHGAFVGAFLAIFETSMRLVNANDEGAQLTRKSKRSLFAGALAGLALFFIPSCDFRISIAIFFFMRALEVILKHQVIQGQLPAIPQFEVIMGSIACAQVCWAGIYNPSSLESSYKHFMYFHGGKTDATYGTLKDVFGTGLVVSPNIVNLNRERSKLSLDPLNFQSPDLSCHIWHGTIDSNCELYLAKYIRQEVIRAFMVYTPLYVMPALIFRFKSLLKNPFKFFLDNLKSISQSSMFLTSFTTMGMYSFCLLRKIAQMVGMNPRRLAGFDAALSGLISGLALFVESPPRRHELSLFIMGHALRSFYFTWRAYLPSLAYGEVLIFSLSMAILMNSYITKSYLMRPGYFSLFRFFFGSGGVEAGFPSEQMVALKNQTAVEIYDYSPRNHILKNS